MGGHYSTWMEILIILFNGQDGSKRKLNLHGSDSTALHFPIMTDGCSNDCCVTIISYFCYSYKCYFE